MSTPPPDEVLERVFEALEARPDADARQLAAELGARLEDVERCLEAARVLDGPPPAREQPGGWHPRPGERVGQYEVLELIGRGGMGLVYRAKDLPGGRDVALKVVLAARPSPAAVARLQREAQVAAALRHPGIVTCHAAGQVGDTPWVVYELIEGARSLREVLPGLDVRARVERVRDVARALGHAHARGVVHRDVKPENVLVDREGRARVTDFGLALAEGQARLTRTGVIAGTLSHMSPEQLRGQPVGPPADVWALGVVLHEALTGELPFGRAASPAELAARILESEPSGIRTHDPALAVDLEAICRRALARKPARRYPHGEALAADLDRWLRGEPLAVVRRPLRVAALGALGLFALAWLVAVRTAPPADPRPPLRAALAEPGDGEALAGALAEALRAGLRDEELLFRARAELARRASGEVALAHARAALALRPGDEELSRLLAERLLALGRGSEALTACPRDERSLLLRARCELAAGSIAAALATLDRERPQSRAGWLLRQRASALQGEDPEAALRARLAEDPHPEVCAALARHFLLAGEAEEAEVVARDGLADHPEHPELTSLLAWARAARGEGELPADVPHEERAAVLARARDEALVQAARSVARPDDVPLRERALLLILRVQGGFPPRSPEAARLHLARASLLPPLQAAEAIEQAVRAWPGSAQARALRGRAALGRGAPAAALADVEQAAPQDADQRRALAEVRGLALLELGRAGEAAPELEAALGRWADSPALCRALARALVDSGGDPARALELRERAALLERPERAGPLLSGLSELPLAEREPILLRALAEAPLAPEVHAQLGKWHIQHLRCVEGLSHSLRAVALDTSFASRLGRNARGMALSVVTGGAPAPTAERDGPLDDWLARAWFLAVMAEFTGFPDVLGPALAATDEALAREPGLGIARLPRAFLSLRRGWTARARRELDLVDDLAPGFEAETAFYRGLILAREGATDTSVLRQLERARGLGYGPREMRSLTIYPELAPRVLASPAFAEQVSAALGLSSRIPPELELEPR